MEFQKKNMLISSFDEQKEVEMTIGIGSGLAYYLARNGEAFLIIHSKSGQCIPEVEAIGEERAQALLIEIAPLLDWSLDFEQLQEEIKRHPEIPDVVRAIAQRSRQEYWKEKYATNF